MESSNIIKGLDKSVDKAVNFLYIATVAASISINIFDIFRLINLSETYILYTNIPTIFTILIAYLLKITNFISLKKSFSFVVLTILANSIISICQSIYLEDLIISLLRESIFIAFLISLSAFVVSKFLSSIITSIFSLFILILYFSTRDNYILENIPVLIMIFVSYTIFINYLVTVLWKTLDELQEKNIIIKRQLEEIRSQNEDLKKINNELYTQREILEDKNDQLNKRNIDLSVSRNELYKLNETKNKLFSVIGHDIKNPMHVVLGYTRLLSDKYHKLEDEKKLNYIRTIDNNIHNLYLLLENLLIWSKSQQNNISYTPEDIDLNRVISESLDLYKDIMRKKEISVEFSTEPDLFSYSDKNMILLVLRNLIDNAIKYSNSNSSVQIIGEKDQKNIIIHVVDNGIGIPSETLKDIFGLNDEKIRPGTKGETGTGFGLSISKEFIEKNNGKIWVTSIPDKETIFSFSLPRKRMN